MAIAGKKAATSADQQAMAAVDKYFSNVSSLTIAGNALTPAALKAALQAEIDAVKAADDGHAVYSGLVAKAQAARVKARQLRKELRAYILGTYGEVAVTMLKDFGIAVPSPKSTSVKTKAQAQVKAEATRKARHTLGKKQKQDIKGTPEMPATPKA
jgi:hypothetical protein